jgi:Ca2+-binding RTX toxin-like protein
MPRAAPAFCGVFLLIRSGYDSAWGISTDRNGHIYVTGYTQGSLPGYNNQGNSDAFVAKYNPNGTQSWVKQFGTNKSVGGKSITTDSTGNIFVTGKFGFSNSGLGSTSDIFITKLSTNGTSVWSLSFGSSNQDSVESITTDSNGNIYVTGSTQGSLQDNTFQGGYTDAYIARFNPNGTLSWIKQFGTSGVDYGNGVITDSNGDIYVSGVATGVFPGNSNQGDRCAYIAKYSPNGTQIWIKQFGGIWSGGIDIAVDSSNYIYVTGSTRGNANQIGELDVYIAVFDANGNLNLPPASITLALNPSNVLEDGTTNLVYTFTRTGATINALTINYTVAGTATFNTDYIQSGAASFTGTAGSITFAAGSSTTTLTLDPTADTTLENDETIILTLAAGIDYTLGTTTTGAGVITNDEIANQPPTNLTISNNIIAENLSVGTIVGNINTTDPDTGNTFTYSLATGTGDTNNNLFTIINNQLQTNVTFDFETQNSYSIRVCTTDQGGLSYEKQLTIAVNNVNETPTGLALSNSSIAENQAINTFVGIFNTTDHDTGDTFTYSLIAGTCDTDNSLFTIWYNQLQTNAVFNYEATNSYSIRVRTTDQSELFFDQQFTINITDISENAIIGTATSNTLNGTSNSDRIEGLNGNDKLYGLAGNDDLYGGAGNDTLDGGTGTDALIGGLGNDTYIVDSTTDTITEVFGAGIDTVQSSLTYTLAADLENLTLTGSAAINGTGNALNNSLIGNTADNTLTGGDGNDTLDGGSGNDTLIGAAGNDSYFFDADLALGTDTLDEAGGGIDTLNFSSTTSRSIALNLGVATSQVANSNLSLILGSATTFENVIGGALDDTLTGNTLANRLNGGSGNDTLNGGAGNDTLIGGLGGDTFRFDSSPNPSTNRDAITDFSLDQGDAIQLENAIFTSLLTTGILAESAFLIGATAITADQRILYNSTTGSLAYDADGVGVVSSAISFATISTGLALTNTSFIVT